MVLRNAKITGRGANILWLLLMLMLILGSNYVYAGGETLNCTDTAWEKVPGMRPESAKLKQNLYTGVDSQGIVSTCFEKCRSLNCTAFIVDLEKSNCFVVELEGGDGFEPEPNVTFYHKICLRVPKPCLRRRNWQVERTLGAILLDPAAVFLPKPTTRAKCYETCMNQVKTCKAAQFRASQDLLVGDTLGQCALLSIERSTKPQTYRASTYRDEYLDYQCHNISKTDFCSYAEYRNSLMPYSDLKVEGLDAKQCEHRCDKSNDGFLCRAYGIEYSTSMAPTCYLHSEDTIGAGVSTLVHSSTGYFKEREPCIDMSVHCTNSTLTVELRTAEPFIGRLYANGFSDLCGVQGHGENLTRLVLPLPNTSNVDGALVACGMTPAYSIDQDNKTRSMIWSTIIVQFNPIIQRLGDQAVRVGCSLDGGEVPSPRNVTVQSGFTFIDSNAGLPPIVTTVMNSSSEVPVVTMDILDKNMKHANVTSLGQELVLKIQITPSDGPFDISAGHLVASTVNGDASLLLLDELGCPVTNVFPVLSKDPTDNRSLLANFSAFKFPDSQHVRFNVVVKFCLERCEPAECSNATSFGRKRRAVDEQSNMTTKVVELSNIRVPNNTAVDLLPLQAQIIVKDNKSSNQDIHPNPLRSRENPDTVLILGTDYMDGKFCMNSGLALFLLIFLLIIQLILIGSCVLAVRTYRRLAIRAEEDRADILARHLYGIHGGNFDISRRVRWADNGSSEPTSRSQSAGWTPVA
ncbi:hypothetical protein QAD02_017687 [Eretmocerus hayati]|uniref:Uncharacterized protein n=1 Tax=Eretmocerus hayati TaxID=131215 RepID=A0ACC2PEA6_9HYME|nr:hypothetical protein QAD02_017687 [Eretmocerus hayati]